MESEKKKKLREAQRLFEEKSSDIYDTRSVYNGQRWKMKSVFKWWKVLSFKTAELGHFVDHAFSPLPSPRPAIRQSTVIIRPR